MDFYIKDTYTIEDINNLITNEVEENIHLDYKAAGALDKKDEVQTGGEIGTAYISAAYKLFCRPTVDIRLGDKLVITYNGITGEFEAGEPYPYKSHIETPLTKKERV